MSERRGQPCIISSDRIGPALLSPSEENVHTGLFCTRISPLVLTLPSNRFHLVISSYQLWAMFRFTQEPLGFCVPQPVIFALESFWDSLRALITVITWGYVFMTAVTAFSDSIIVWTLILFHPFCASSSTSLLQPPTASGIWVIQLWSSMSWTVSSVSLSHKHRHVYSVIHSCSLLL